MSNFSFHIKSNLLKHFFMFTIFFSLMKTLRWALHELCLDICFYKFLFFFENVARNFPDALFYKMKKNLKKYVWWPQRCNRIFYVAMNICKRYHKNAKKIKENSQSAKHFECGLIRNSSKVQNLSCHYQICAARRACQPAYYPAFEEKSREKSFCFVS